MIHQGLGGTLRKANLAKLSLHFVPGNGVESDLLGTGWVHVTLKLGLIRRRMQVQTSVGVTRVGVAYEEHLILIFSPTLAQLREQSLDIGTLVVELATRHVNTSSWIDFKPDITVTYNLHLFNSYSASR